MKKDKIKNNRFPPSLFFVYFLVLLLMSGIHTGLVVGMNELKINDFLQTVIPLLYWAVVAIGLTLFTRNEIKKNYEEPMHLLADATKKVAEGDFSVYVPTIHPANKMDYLDIMLIDFNKMVEELGSIETLKTDFFSNVSHEFKTPLSVIYNNAQLLQKEEQLNEQEKEYVENILYSTKRLSNLIQNMLKLNKLEKQTITPTYETYDLCEQLCQCALQFEDTWEQKQIDFEVDIEEQAYVNLDPGLMELVWTNLLSNAIKFTPEEGKITLKQESSENQVIVSVEDSGCGMSKQVVEHIFDKFYQGDSSHSTYGNGLGLALVKRVMELSNGKIEVMSEVGKGSLFKVILPLKKERD